MSVPNLFAILGKCEAKCVNDFISVSNSLTRSNIVELLLLLFCIPSSAGGAAAAAVAAAAAAADNSAV